MAAFEPYLRVFVVELVMERRYLGRGSGIVAEKRRIF
jgi:hypothetical protein